MSDQHFSAIEDIHLREPVLRSAGVLCDHTENDWSDFSRDNRESDLIWTQVDQCFERLLEDTTRISMAQWKPYIVALYICFEEIFKNCNQVQKRRIAREYQR